MEPLQKIKSTLSIAQPNTLHGKIAKDLGLTSKEVINNLLMLADVYVQWLPIFKEYDLKKIGYK